MSDTTQPFPPLLGISLGLIAANTFFNRQPRRQVPAGEQLIVSPADGRIIHIENTNTQQISFFKHDVLNELTVIGLQPPFQVVVIELNVWDVHVQRAPIAGCILAQHYYPGQFRNAVFSEGKVHLVNTNEKLLTVIGNAHTAVAVIQVAGLLARRLHRYVCPGDVVGRGQRIGRITMGSQVVLVLQQDARLNVQVGDRLIDGESIIACMGAQS